MGCHLLAHITIENGAGQAGSGMQLDAVGAFAPCSCSFLQSARAPVLHTPLRHI
jgi:hypothetical protein